MRDSRVVRLQEKHSGELGDQVRAQSVLLQTLAGQMASAVRGMTQAVVESRPEAPSSRNDAKAAKPGKSEAPRIPVVTPGASPAAEVYRF